MSDDLVSDLISLKPFLEAHHCRTDAIDRAIAAIRKDDELRDALEKLNALRRLCDSCQQDFYVEIIDEITGALSSVAGGGG